MEYLDDPESINLESDQSDTPISVYRQAIDKIDQQILELINKRLEIAAKVGKAKQKTGIQVMDPARESLLLERLSNLNTGPLSKKMLYQIFSQIIASSREMQKSHRVSYLGPEATFTHMAAMSYFGRALTYIPQSSIRDVFMDVEKGASHYGVVPVENSIEGAVNHTLDLFYETDLKICAEIYQPISHDLLGKSINLKDIQKIYSHPHAFGQCRRWLQKYLPDVELEECSSTAVAAQKAAVSSGTAAIASSAAAELYHLDVIASRIEDVARNTTRFLVIGHDQPHRTGNDKTSLMFVTAHVPGALFRVLKPIADAQINMVKLESRPTKHQNWSYFFIADMEGHIEDPVMNQTIESMKTICLFIKWLGSYPRAPEI